MGKKSLDFLEAWKDINDPSWVKDIVHSNNLNTIRLGSRPYRPKADDMGGCQKKKTLLLIQKWEGRPPSPLGQPHGLKIPLVFLKKETK